MGGFPCSSDIDDGSIDVVAWVWIESIEASPCFDPTKDVSVDIDALGSCFKVLGPYINARHPRSSLMCGTTWTWGICWLSLDGDVSEVDDGDEDEVDDEG